MSRPSWAHSGATWDPSPGPSQSMQLSAFSQARPLTAFSLPSRPVCSGDSGHRDRARGRTIGLEHSEPLQLGKTEGLTAAGAWAARWEIASFLESGVPGERILQAIKSGEEGSHPLELIPKSRRSRSPRRGTPHRQLLESSIAGEGQPSFTQSTFEGTRRVEVAGAAISTLSFRKRAVVPGVTSEVASARSNSLSPEPSPGLNFHIHAEKTESTPEPGDVNPVDPEFLNLLDGFNKKAKQPPARPLPQPKVPKPPPNRIPLRADPRSLDKQASYDALAKELFEELVLLEVRMDLVELVTFDAQVDEVRFLQLTEPRSPDTGLRYARLLMRYLDFVKKVEPQPAKGAIFTALPVGSFIESLISSGAGYRTPQAFLYSLEYFAVLFGYESPKLQMRRWKRAADDYAKRAPPRCGAPFLDVGFLQYLEAVVLDEGRAMVERVTAGKLRLCVQASLRHSDLTSTPVKGIEWCRFKGSCNTLGVRAKAPATKTGPRPWVASFLGVTKKGDNWLRTLMELLLQSHGRGWEEHEFLGCAPHREETFFSYPSTISTDTDIIRRMLSRDHQAGKVIPLSPEEASAFRWHGAKATMATFMGHLGLKTKIIRFQGAWKKSTEAMPDLYLRETQTLVLQGQIAILDKLRKGAALNILEGKPLSDLRRCVPQLSRKYNGEPGWIMVSGDEEWEVPGQESQAMADVSVYEMSQDGSEILKPDLCPDVSELTKEFRDEKTREVEDPRPALQEEEKEDVGDPEAFFQGASNEMSSEEDEGSREDEDPRVNDLELFSHFVVLSSGAGKVHKHGRSNAESPACGTTSRRFSILGLDEAWSENYELCSRCFGKAGTCPGLCSFVDGSDDNKARCGRRCGLACSRTESGLSTVSHACLFHMDDSAESAEG